MVEQKQKKVVVIIQARMGSERLPGKMMLDLCGKSTLIRVIDRVKESSASDDVCVATSDLPADDVIAYEAKANGVKVYRGSSDNVLDRYIKAAASMGADYVVRVTGDNPLTEPRFIDLCVEKIMLKGFDYVTVENMPYGSNVEVVSLEALIRSSKKANSEEQEHVTLYIKKNCTLFNTCSIDAPAELRRPDLRLTLDTIDDYVFLYGIFKCCSRDGDSIRLESVIRSIDNLKKCERQ